MKYGLTLPYNATTHFPQWAQLAEEKGWDGLFLGDAIWLEDPLVALSAAAMVTERVRLGTMIIATPLRQPWKIASESVALDLLSNGRLILGLGAGAVWMGWHAFPGLVTEAKARAEILDETIDILTLLYRRKPFDYEGKHFQLQLTALDEMYYPPPPLQQPRIPLWIPAQFPRPKSLRRLLKCDGVLPEKLDAAGQPQPITPQDVRQIKTFVDENRELETPFDIVITGKTGGIDVQEQNREIGRWSEAGATWWIEDVIGDDAAAVVARIEQGPPRTR
jgi:hypothetical protein